MSKPHFRRTASGQTVMVNDGLQSLATRLGTSQAKAETATYAVRYLDWHQLITAFSSSWAIKKAVTIPAQDATRKWRQWIGDDAEAVQEAERVSRILLRKKVYEAQWKARLYGGSAILIGLRDGALDQPLEVKSIGQGDLEYLSVLTPSQITAWEIETDPRAEFFGRPNQYRMWTTTGEDVRVHPTRLALFYGAPRATLDDGSQYSHGWDESILQSIYEACRNLDSTMANVAELVFDAKTDVVKIPDLSERINDINYEQALLKRFATARMLKGNMGTLILDGGEEYVSTSYGFSGLDGVADRFMQVASGAADIPMTRFLSMSPGGLNSTGESDLTNYYDGVASMQVNDLQPAISLLDQALVRSTLGDWSDDLTFEWLPLRQLTEQQIAEQRNKAASTLKTVAETQLYDDDAVADFGAELFQSVGLTSLSDAKLADDDDLDLSDAAPRTLYVHRKVKNGGEIIKWAKSQGFKTTLPEDDLHVTIAFSRRAVDWMQAGSDWEPEIMVGEGGPRLMEQFGEARVLLFGSSTLSWRHEAIKRQTGATWDHPEYQPHITISYDPYAPDLAEIEPYTGRILLGPEVFQEVKEDWKERIQEE